MAVSAKEHISFGKIFIVVNKMNDKNDVITPMQITNSTRLKSHIVEMRPMLLWFFDELCSIFQSQRILYNSYFLSFYKLPLQDLHKQ